MEYVYRALRANEFYNKWILCKEYFEYAPLVGIPQYGEHLGKDALDLVGAHLTKGKNTITPWISCTKDYNTLKKYMYGKNERVYGMAFIKNHNEDIFNCPRFFSLVHKFNTKEIDYNQFVSETRKIELYNVKKLVLDFSYGDSALFRNFMASGLVLFGDGRIRPYLTRFEHNYSFGDKEVIALGEIKNEDTYICNNLVFDLLNYLKDNEVFESFNDEMLQNIIDDLAISYSLLSVQGVGSEDILRNTIKDTYDRMDAQLKEIFIQLYIKNKKKINYIYETKISSDYLDNILKNMYKMIIDDSEYLSELVNSCPNEVKRKILMPNIDLKK